MVVLFLKCSKILKETDASFDIITTAIVFAGENDHDLCHDGHDVHAFGESEYTCPMKKIVFQS
jgi:hypothetical protein